MNHSAPQSSPPPRSNASLGIPKVTAKEKETERNRGLLFADHEGHDEGGDDETTDTYTTFASDNEIEIGTDSESEKHSGADEQIIEIEDETDTASEDFFISTVKPPQSRSNTKKQQKKQKLPKPKQIIEESENTDSDDLFVTNSKKPKTSILQNGTALIVNMPPALLHSKSGIIRTSNPPPKKPSSAPNKAKQTKEDISLQKLAEGRKVERYIAPPEELEELPDISEFSEVYDTSIASTHPYENTNTSASASVNANTSVRSRSNTNRSDANSNSDTTALRNIHHNLPPSSLLYPPSSRPISMELSPTAFSSFRHSSSRTTSSSSIARPRSVELPQGINLSDRSHSRVSHAQPPAQLTPHFPTIPQMTTNNEIEQGKGIPRSPSVKFQQSGSPSLPRHRIEGLFFELSPVF